MFRMAPQLETDRLVLRPHTLDDLDDLTAMWGDRNVVRYIGGRVSTREECWARLLRYAGSWALLGYGFWTIRDRTTGVYLGEGGLLQGKRGLDSAFGETPEVGWALKPAAQGKGHASEALEAILSWADAANMVTTVCMIEPDNQPSIRLAEKLGYREYSRTTYHGAKVNLYRRGPEG